SILHRFLVVALATLSGFAAIFAISTNNFGIIDRATEDARRNAAIALEAQRLNGLAFELRLAERAFLDSGDPTRAQPIQQTLAQMGQRLGRIRGLVTRDEFLAPAQRAGEALERYTEKLREMATRFEALGERRRDMQRTSVAIGDVFASVRAEVSAGV